MMTFKQFLEKNLDDLFGSTKFSPVISREERTTPYVLTLYRGFDADLSQLEQDAGHYYLSPKRSEQGMLWFTHAFIRGYNALTYAANHGEWLLTYPLSVKRHIQINTQQNGKTFNAVPDYFEKLAEPTENSRFHAGIELPEGWIFSYKTEKFIGCSKKLRVNKEWIKPSQEWI